MITNTELKLKKFVFEDKEIEDIHSLTSVLVRLTCAGLNSLHPRKKDQLESAKHLSECKQCQEILLDTSGYFIGRLVMARKKWRRPFLRFFKNLFRQIFGPKKRKERLASLAEINAVSLMHPYFLSLFARTEIFVNSEEKRKIFQRYIPSFSEKKIMPEEIFGMLTKRTDEKREDLTAEEFEKILKELAQ